MERKDWLDQLIISDNDLNELIKSVNLKDQDINPYHPEYKGWSEKIVRINCIIKHVKERIDPNSPYFSPPVEPLKLSDLDQAIKILLDIDGLIGRYEEGRETNNRIIQNDAEKFLKGRIIHFNKIFSKD